jgi:large subunit ribosomal protein L23
MGLLNRKKTIKKEEPKKTALPQAVAANSKGIPAEAVGPVAAAKSVSEGGVASQRVIVKPLITEKAAVAQSLNKYSFIVNRRATKTEIKRAVKEIYGILPTGVNISNIEGKRKFSGRVSGRRQDYKKAMVTLPKGQSITIHEGV